MVGGSTCWGCAGDTPSWTKGIRSETLTWRSPSFPSSWPPFTGVECGGGGHVRGVGHVRGGGYLTNLLAEM